MARVEIKDIPRDQKISKDELKRIKGGSGVLPHFRASYVKPVPALTDLSVEGMTDLQELNTFVK